MMNEIIDVCSIHKYSSQLKGGIRAISPIQGYYVRLCCSARVGMDLSTWIIFIWINLPFYALLQWLKVTFPNFLWIYQFFSNYSHFYSPERTFWILSIEYTNPSWCIMESPTLNIYYPYLCWPLLPAQSNLNTLRLGQTRALSAKIHIGLKELKLLHHTQRLNKKILVFSEIFS